MTFPLSEQLVLGIVNALENQERGFLVDAELQVLVDTEEAAPDENRFYGLPEWNSADGFALMADFVEKLRSSSVQSELRRVLYTGRGVFKSFKNVLRYGELSANGTALFASRGDLNGLMRRLKTAASRCMTIFRFPNTLCRILKTFSAVFHARIQTAFRIF